LREAQRRLNANEISANIHAIGSFILLVDAYHKLTELTEQREPSAILTNLVIAMMFACAADILTKSAHIHRLETRELRRLIDMQTPRTR